MERGSRIWLGIFTFLPIVLLFAYMAFFAVIVWDIMLKNDDISLLADIGPALLLVLAIGIIAFGLSVYYIIHVINSKLDNNEKILWLIFFVTCNILAFPIYWYMRIWKSPTENMSMIAN
jgi:hypothetical protein